MSDQTTSDAFDHQDTSEKDLEGAPKWRKDFPIEWGVDNYITRREFTKFLVLISGATTLGNGYFVLKKFQEGQVTHPAVEVATADEVPVGGVKLFRYPTDNDPAILLHLEQDKYAAYMQRCTHLTCPVHFSIKSGHLECPCHHGGFDAETGRVLYGPPPRPLPRIKLRMADGRIYAEGIDQGEQDEV